MSFKGEKTFKTSIGAMMSVIVMTVFLTYSVYKATILFYKTDLTTNTNTYV
jgi:hypothetical protein